MEENIEENEEKVFDGNEIDTATSGGIIECDMDKVLHNSMIPYSEFVILDRALPRVEDGLKPVQRRILYAMMDLGLTPDKPFKKSARIVGECLGKYHPHGDTSVYDAMVRMAQPHNMRDILVEGHGNFGSNDGDGAAAMRYTEARLAPLALELLKDLEKDTVHWSLNFDDSLKEPDMLPGRFPNLLVNGASGIAVGLATNIPPHNLGEVIDGVVAYIDNPNITLKKMMTHIKGPDFPTGGMMTTDELEQAYETGKGKIYMYPKYHIEEGRNEKQNIVITELPYQVNKAKLLQNIAALPEEKGGILADIADVRDESDRNGMRAVIIVKKDGNPKKIMDALMSCTDLKCTFAINMVAIADGKPKTLGLLEIIEYYVKYQKNIILRRSKYDLNVAEERQHILQGLLIAIKNIDEVVQIIKKSASTTDAKAKLKERFMLSERQAQAILDMRLARLTSLEVNKIADELKELEALIAKLTAIINSEALQYQTVKEELLDIKKRYKTPRLTQIVSKESVAQVEKVQVDVAVPVILALSADGMLKAMEPKSYAASVKSTTKDEREISQVFVQTVEVDSHSEMLAFTDSGYCLRFDMSYIKIVKPKDKGVVPQELFKELSFGDKIVCVLKADFTENDERNIVFFTKYGMVKKTAFSEYNTVKSYVQAIKLKEDDVVLNVEFDSDRNLFFATANGQVLLATNDDVPVQGRVSGGVHGISFFDDDYCLFAGTATGNEELVLITKDGFGKRIELNSIEKLGRYRKGVRAILLDNTDVVTFASVISMPCDIAVVTNKTVKLVPSEKIALLPREKKGNIIKEIGKVTLAYKSV